MADADDVRRIALALPQVEEIDGWPLVMLRLIEVDAGRLEELVTDAWRMRAPRELAAQLDQRQRASGTLPDGT